MIKPTDEFPFVVLQKDSPNGLPFRSRFTLIVWLLDHLTDNDIKVCKYKWLLHEGI